MPIVLLWGIIWIVKGFRTKKKLKSKIDPEIKKKVKKFCKLAEDAGMELDKFLFDKGTKIGDVEAFINLQKQVQQEDRILGLDTLKKIKKLDEEKIFCASCGSVFIKKYGKVDSDGISICPDCYHKKIKS